MIGEISKKYNREVKYLRQPPSGISAIVQVIANNTLKAEVFITKKNTTHIYLMNTPKKYYINL